MKKYVEEILFLGITMMLLFFGLGILIAGRVIYGSDASLIWASGILTFMGINGFMNFIRYLWSLKEENN
jgi:cytochrome c biogenesis protein CcdA